MGGPGTPNGRASCAAVGALPILGPARDSRSRPPGALPWRLPWRASRLYLVQLVDQLDRLQLERETSTPVLSVELQLDRLQLERVKSRPRLLSAVLQDDRLHEERL